MAEGYFDIDAILASEPRVYVQFDVVGRGLSHLSDRIDEDEVDLPLGSRVAVPFWLAESLTERQMVRVSVPRCYTSGGPVRNSLRADAVSADLRAASPHYFTLGVRVASLVRAPGIAPALLQARAVRAWRAVDAGAHAAHGASPLLRRLDDSERGVFFAARNAAVARERWIERRSTRLSAAPTIRRTLPPIPAGKRRAAEISPVTPRNAQRQRVR